MDAVEEKVSPPSKAKEYCFICGGIDKENDVSLFYIPSGKFSVWQRIIVKPGLTARSRLCEAHFLPSEIDKGVIVEGQFVKRPRVRLLSKDVLPSKNLGDRSTPTPKRTRQPLKPTILNIGSPAGGPRVCRTPVSAKRSKIVPVKPWPPELVSAVTSLVDYPPTPNRPRNSQPSNVASSDMSNHVDQHLNVDAFGDGNIPFQDLEMDSFMTNLTIPDQEEISDDHLTEVWPEDGHVNIISSFLKVAATNNTQLHVDGESSDKEDSPLSPAATLSCGNIVQVDTMEKSSTSSETAATVNVDNHVELCRDGSASNDKGPAASCAAQCLEKFVAPQSSINVHSNCNGCNKFVSITARRKRNSNFKKVMPPSCINCFKKDKKIAEQKKIIRNLRQQKARLTSYFGNMASKIEEFQVELKDLTNKSLETQIAHLKPQGKKLTGGAQ